MAITCPAPHTRPELNKHLLGIISFGSPGRKGMDWKLHEAMVSICVVQLLVCSHGYSTSVELMDPHFAEEEHKTQRAELTCPKI